MSWKFLLILKSKNIVHRICSAHRSDKWTFMRLIVFEHNTHKNFRDTCFKKQFDHSRTVLFCIACSWKKSDGNCTFLNFCRACYGWNNLANGIFPWHKLEVFTEVSECMHAVLSITHRRIVIFCVCVRGFVCVCFFYESVINMLFTAERSVLGNTVPRVLRTGT